ncbi:MAG: response regulator transcription factor [Anaerolineae bacterium]
MRVLVVEDNPGWQKLFSEIIQDAGYEPCLAASYAEALSTLAEPGFALAVIDVSLSEQLAENRDGVAVLRKIAALPHKLPAIIVTGYATVDLAVETLVDLNAVNFFRKDDFDRRKFNEVIAKEALPTRPADAVKPVSTALDNLSEREREVLALLTQGYTNKEIAQQLVVTVNTVKKHTQSIFTKLNVNSRAAAVGKALSGD